MLALGTKYRSSAGAVCAICCPETSSRDQFGLRLEFNCLCLPSARIQGVYQHTRGTLTALLTDELSLQPLTAGFT